MRQDIPLAQDVVLIGGGHTHALLLRAWGMKPVPGARLTVINPEPTAPYTGMLPGHVAGHYTREELDIDLVRLARFADARLILGYARHIDPEAKLVHVPDRPPIRYDLCSVDIGITSNMPALPGSTEHGIPAKPLGPFAERWRQFTNAPGPICVIGGGVGGVELALAMRHRLSDKTLPITLIERERILAGVGPKARATLLDELRNANVTIHENTTVTRIDSDSVILDTGDAIPSAFTLGAAGATPHPWLLDTGLHLTNGYITVRSDLRSTSHKDVYACGDCAHLSHAPRPKAGVFAVRAAPILTANLRADLTGGARRNFNPQSGYLKLVSLGRKAALADKWGLAPAAPWVWRWKDHIDRKFMDKLADLPAMRPPSLPNTVAKGVAEALGPKPLCGGCGAKVGATTLDAALRSTDLGQHADVEVASGDDAAVLNMNGTRLAISTDHLRAVWPDPLITAQIAAVHALSDIRAMGATPQAMLAQITLPRLAPPMQEAWLADILAGAAHVAKAAGAQIVGGHTSIGAELTIGFTVTGRFDGAPRILSGAEPGDHLILTRPLGTGVILAAEMALAARGSDVETCLTQMRGTGDDTARLSAAHALTDVTGFGLAGHLSRMCAASGTGASVRLADIPLLPGAERLAAEGIRSSIYEANRAQLPEITDTSDPRTALLFDPQTAGGFLAALAPEDASQALTALHDANIPAAIVGEITEQRGLRIIR